MRARRGAGSKKRRFILISLLGLAFILFGLHRFYVYAHTDVWNEDAVAVQKAKEQTDLVTVNRVDSFVWDDPYRIIFGENKAGESMIVWVGTNSVHAELQKNGRTREQLKEQILKEKTDISLMRLTPGYFQGQYVWEAFYKEKDKEGDTRFNYDFYRFADGSFIETVYLPNR